MSTMAFLAASHGPSGFSFASITTAPGWKTLRSSAARDASVAIRNAIAAVAAADNWRNALREAFESTSLLFIRPSSQVRKFSVEKSDSACKCNRIGFRPAHHYSTESGDDLSASRIRRLSDPLRDFGLPWKFNLTAKIG